MPGTLEKRVEDLERKFTELAEQSLARGKAWQKTFGFSRGDEGFVEMTELAKEYRRSISDGDRSANS